MQHTSTACTWGKAGRVALAAVTAMALSVPMVAPAAASAAPASSAPAQAKVAKAVSGASGQVTVTVSKTAKASGYQYAVATNKSFTKGKVAKASSKTSYTFKSLKKGATYYVKARA